MRGYLVCFFCRSLCQTFSKSDSVNLSDSEISVKLFLLTYQTFFRKSSFRFSIRFSSSPARLLCTPILGPTQPRRSIRRGGSCALPFSGDPTTGDHKGSPLRKNLKNEAGDADFFPPTFAKQSFEEPVDIPRATPPASKSTSPALYYSANPPISSLLPCALFRRDIDTLQGETRLPASI